MAGSRTQQIAGWALSALLGAFLIIGTIAGQLVEWEGKSEELQRIGYSENTMTWIAVVAVVISVLFLIPRTSFLGAILLTGYLGGAVATHVRVGDPFLFPLIFGMLVWLALSLRNPQVFKMAQGSTQTDVT